jgi:pimeloyl-ACP methyl ester carboxylesterase
MIRDLKPGALFAFLLSLFILSGCASTYRKVADYAIRSDRQQAGLERKEITLPDGLKYVYLEGGQGEPLMLLHGFGANKDTFARVSRYLTAHYRVIVPDHIGFGESSHPEEADYKPTAQVERIRALANAIGASQLHLGGNSMGGHIALAYASRYPNEVSSLWLLNPGGVWSAPVSEVAEVIAKSNGRHNPLIIRNEDDYAELFDLVMSIRPFAPRPILDVLAQERIKNRVLEERIFQDLINDPIDERIRGLGTPSLIVWGAEDRVIHVGTADIMQKLMPRSKVIVMRGIGHVPMMENPAQAAADYLAFRDGLPGAKPQLTAR